MAETLKKHQQAMTIDEQIANLKAIGLQIDNEDYARRILVFLNTMEYLDIKIKRILLVKNITDNSLMILRKKSGEIFELLL